MNKPSSTIEQRLIAAGGGKGTNTVFVRNVMEAIHKAASAHTFNSVLCNEKRRRSLFGWFRQLPKGVAIALVALLCAVVTGSAYAAYTLWISPKAEVNSVIKQYGRSQALIDLRNCYQKDQKVTVEITNGSGGTPAEAAQAVGSQCEIQAIENWAIQGFHLQPSYVTFAFTVTKVHGNVLTVQNYETKQSQEITLTKGLPIAFQGRIVPASALKQGDTLALLMKNGGKNLTAVVKLSYPASIYLSSRVQNSYHERDACIGNPDASCINLPNIDVLRAGEGGANPDTRGEGYEIQGKLVNVAPTEFTLEATSGKQYVVHTDSDVIGAFNGGNPYGPITIEPGDVLMVMYSQAASDNHQDIQSTQYHMVQLMLQGFSKSDPAGSLSNSGKYHY